MTTNDAEQLSFAEHNIELLRSDLFHDIDPDYPSHAARLVLDQVLQNQPGGIEIADGPWSVNSHPNRQDTDTVPTPEQRLALNGLALRFDSFGRPLHPWFDKMAYDPLIGVATGKGAFWQWGPNYTVDAVVIQHDHVLLIQKPSGLWGTPGGFIDLHNGEAAKTAAIRETAEETSVIISPGVQPQAIYSGVIADGRTTAHAWPETQAFLYQLADGPLPKAMAGDDAVAAKWFPIDNYQYEQQPMGAHKFLIRKALEALL